jgi:pyruvate/2-oxoglutarate dehydrogenase complex dihydrolipoamide acyltransferase (E2) component
MKEEADIDHEEDSDKKQGPKETAASPGEGHEDDVMKKGDDIPAVPLARKFARELGIDIAELKRSNDDRITREDVFEHARVLIEKKNQGGKSSEQGIALLDFSKWGETHHEPLSKKRLIIARRTIQSWRNISQVIPF